jgi:N-acetylmuramoyl-L-alanine amidase
MQPMTNWRKALPKVIGPNLPHDVQRSPNFGERLDGKTPKLLILHYTGMSSAKKACDWLCDERSEVSSHYLIEENGRIVQMVDEAARAWHAGVSSWHGELDVNSASIGIEIQNPGHSGGYPEFPKIQMQAVAELCLDIIDRHSILPQNVLAHSDVAPGRKIDPGEKFDWAYLASRGVGQWVEPEPLTGGSFLQLGDEGDPVFALQSMLRLYGYGLEVTGVFDARTKTVVEAFQRHFRQARVDGIADQSTVVTLHRLLKS